MHQLRRGALRPTGLPRPRRVPPPRPTDRRARQVALALEFGGWKVVVVIVGVLGGLVVLHLAAAVIGNLVNLALQRRRSKQRAARAAMEESSEISIFG